MKKLKFIFIVLISGIVIIFSCNKKNEDVSLQVGKMSTIINGKSISFNVSAFHSKTTNSELGPFETIELIGTNGTSTSDSSKFQIWIDALTINSRTYKASGVGTDSGIIRADYKTNSLNDEYYMGYTADSLLNSKNVIIVELITSKLIKGTYNFTLTNKTDWNKTITSGGSFYASIIEIKN